ncbi:MAG: baseplate J/gp47 family protein, partial [Bacteroidia bacterium]
MTGDCNNKNPLLRDGTSQQQRLLKALLPSYVSVDERSMQDLIDFAANYGKEIKYWEANNTYINNTWESFFRDQVIDEAGQTTQPHYALFIAFLEIFKFAQTDLNTITQRHLDFYYRDVLRLEEKEAIPDQVFIIFELAQQVASHLVVQGTALSAQKDATGVDLTYDTTKDIVVNTAQVAELKSLFYNKSFDQRLYASPIANSDDGLGKEIGGDEKKWRTFGAISDPTLPFNSPLIDRQQAEVGFALASPILLMGEGNRYIRITLNCSSITNISSSEIKNAFNVSFSGEKAWIPPVASTTKLPHDNTYISGSSIVIERTLTVDQPAVIPYNQTVLLSPFNTQWPVAKSVLNTSDTSNPYIYEKLKALVITNAQIFIEVDGVKNLVLQNDQSGVDASKPFQPFGNRPVITSSFYIGSSEVFSKSISSLDIDITWKGLPDAVNGFAGYYQHYIPAAENANRKNGSFRTNISVLDGKAWKSVVPSASDISRLFNPPTDSPLQNFRRMNIPGSNFAFYNRDPEFGLSTLTDYDNNSARGFVRLEIANVDFGHGDYQNSFATQALMAAKAADSAGVLGFPLPNEPYTPLISELTLSYTSTVTIQLANTATVNNEAAFDNRIDQFFHIEPFGVAETHPFITTNTGYVPLMPVYSDEGSLYIGLSALNPPENLSLLIKVAEGSANPDFPKQPVKWSYMVNNEWKDFPALKILSDSTNGLLTSGIIVFDISKTITNTNTLLTGGLHWLKASVETDSGAVCELIDLRTQAVMAVFTDNGNDPNHLLTSLPAETIKNLVVSDDAIDKVSQPYASFGGKVKEQPVDFYTRVSERLRHKNRAVNIWDYEHLVLEKFQDIYKVKCLNHTRYVSVNDIKELAPGSVSVVAIADLRNKNAIDPLKPKTSLILLTEIQQFLQLINPPCVDLHVRNPLYEEITVEFNVRFLPGFDNGFYGQKLEQDIKQFLAPWAYGTADIVFGGVIHRSMILNFVEEQVYVDYVTCFKMNQIIGTVILKDIEEASTTTSASILTSASSHAITVMETDDCDCKDNLVEAPFEPVDNTCDCGCDDCGHTDASTPGSTKKPRPFGVGYFQVGSSFIVGNGIGFA